MQISKTSLLALMNLVFLSLGLGATLSHAEEAPKVVAPKGIIVRIDETEDRALVYKATELNVEMMKKNPKAFAVAIKKNAKDENLLSGNEKVALTTKIKAKKSELDEDTSTPAWWGWWYGSYWYPSAYTQVTYYNYNYGANWYFYYGWRHQYNYQGYRWYFYW